MGILLDMTQELVLFTTTEVATHFGVDASTVRKWVSDKKIQPEVTTPGGQYRFTREEIERVKNSRQPTKAAS